MAEVEPLAQSILDFWFGTLSPEGLSPADKKKRWFTKDPAFDDSIKRIYGSYLETAYMGSLDRWTQSLPGTVAILVLLDQFPRNIFRNHARAWEFDPKAQSLCLQALKQWHLAEVPPHWAYFMLMPTMHAEDLSIQDQGLELFRGLAKNSHPEIKKTFELASDYAQRHRDIIAQFGRFPHRNDILGRPSTEEEKAFLQQPGSSF